MFCYPPPLHPRCPALTLSRLVPLDQSWLLVFVTRFSIIALSLFAGPRRLARQSLCISTTAIPSSGAPSFKIHNFSDWLTGLGSAYLASLVRVSTKEILVAQDPVHTLCLSVILSTCTKRGTWSPKGPDSTQSAQRESTRKLKKLGEMSGEVQNSEEP